MSTTDLHLILTEIETTYTKRVELEKTIQDYDRLINNYDAWGDFSVKTSII